VNTGITVDRATLWRPSTENRPNGVIDPTPIRGILFDMDGVLCDSEPIIREAASQMLLERYDLKVHSHDFDAFVGTGEGRFIQGAAGLHGVQVRFPGDKDRTYEIYLELIRGRLKPMPGVVAFLERCRRLRLRTAVATSADRIKLEGNLREIRVGAEGFDALVSGDDIRAPKPDPEIFVTAAARINVPPKHCLVVEDAPHGITAGLRAGCRCLGITSSFDAETLLEAGAHWTAPDLTAVPDGIPLPAEEAPV
jgi:HAD superfamily hydrolase (TIGR01509 family)